MLERLTNWLIIAAALGVCWGFLNLAQTIQDQRIEIHGLIHTQQMEHRAVVRPLPERWREGRI